MHVIGYASVVGLLIFCALPFHCLVEPPVEGKEYDLNEIVSWISHANNTVANENNGLRLKRSKDYKEASGNVKLKKNEKENKTAKKVKHNKSKKEEKVAKKSEKVTEKTPLGQRRMINKNHPADEIGPRSNYLTDKKLASLSSNEKASLVIMEAMAIWRDVNDALQMGDSAPQTVTDLLDISYPKIPALPSFPRVNKSIPLAVVADLVGNWISEAVDRIYPRRNRGSSSAGEEIDLDIAPNARHGEKAVKQGQDDECSEDKQSFANEKTQKGKLQKQRKDQKPEVEEVDTTEIPTTEKSHAEPDNTELSTTEAVTAITAGAPTTTEKDKNGGVVYCEESELVPGTTKEPSRKIKGGKKTKKPKAKKSKKNKKDSGKTNTASKDLLSASKSSKEDIYLIQ